MKTVFLSFAIAGLLPRLAHAAPLAVAWSTISGGAATSSDGRFAVAGNIGIAAPGATSDGSRFTLDHGFWVAVDLMDPISLPRLRIERSGSSAILIWSLPAEDFSLEACPDLLRGIWSPVTIEPETIGDERRVTVPLQPDSRFFRLRKL